MTREAFQVEPGGAVRVAQMTALLDRIEGLDAETMFESVPTVLHDRLASPRFAQRLMRRHVKRFVGTDVFTPVSDDLEAVLIEASPEDFDRLIACAGAHVLSSDVLRIVRRSDLETLERDLGVSVRDAALRGERLGIGVKRRSRIEAGLDEAIRDEGALCWACWLTTRGTAARRRLRALTPLHVVARIPGALDDDADARRLRAAVFTTELEAYLSNLSSEAA